MELARRLPLSTLPPPNVSEAEEELVRRFALVSQSPEEVRRPREERRDEEAASFGDGRRIAVTGEEVVGVGGAIVNRAPRRTPACNGPMDCSLRKRTIYAESSPHDVW